MNAARRLEPAADDEARWLLGVPVLRPTFTRDGHVEQWAGKCPWWCRDATEGHTAKATTAPGGRVHRSRRLLVRQDHATGYDDESDDGMHFGVHTGHLALTLTQGSRAGQPAVSIAGHDGKGGNRPTTRLAPLFLDEVRELVAALQFLLEAAE